MTALWIVLGIVLYMAGFTLTARAVNKLDQRWERLRLGVDEDVLAAIMWPIVWLAVLVWLPFSVLYHLATRDLKHGKDR